MSGDFTADGFLGGRLTIAQPREGFRSGHDAVLLAAAVPAKEGDHVFEFGAGAGVASLCLAARVPGCRVMGFEIDKELVALAHENAKRNGMEKRVRFICGDAGATFGLEEFEHAFFNPPFHPDTGQVSPDAQRDRATRDTGDAVRKWTARALPLVKPDGTVTAILRADRLEDFLEVTGLKGVIVLPLLPAPGAPPKRVIVQARKGDSRAPFIAPGFALHEDGRPTHGAEAILRHMAALPLTRA